MSSEKEDGRRVGSVMVISTPALVGSRRGLKELAVRVGGCECAEWEKRGE